MPRRNRTAPHTHYNAHGLSHATHKRPYTSEQQAKQAITEAQKYNPELKLHTYQSLTDGKWYLSSKNSSPSTSKQSGAEY